ncbi:MaoC family dehydratase [Jatrophihabitans telluris]|uniref:MaoC family dehydratase n=1 Tax=Jatrophihabitans telluris TaxID=2038343 RepID=A0ABY4QYH4_9ACTN|nr:MaoC family dehydratase [Jatrophihabitans telluris]UQX88041.1 MaoC family dehydratase [Jatrophihabitans telluris]
MSPTLADLAVGTELPSATFPIERVSMVRYAGASGDFNPIHWNEDFAKQVGLPDVIAHGMLTMAIAVRVVSDWAGDPGAVVEYGVRFTRPVVVPADSGAALHVSAKVRSIDSAAGTVVVDVTASVNGETVLARARATVKVPAS